ncbi:MAG TPA: ATP-binding protein, partial [Solirubrobacteraceae bacterium]
VRLEVRDAGRGLPGPLPPAAGHTRHRGHGLAVAARVAREGGGRLRSERRPGGHTMALELPAAGRPAGRARLAAGRAG